MQLSVLLHSLANYRFFATFRYTQPKAEYTQPKAKNPSQEPENPRPEPKERQLALEAAKHWLELVDSEKYGEGWDEAAEYLKNVVSRDDFQHQLAGVRKPLGPTLKREVKSDKYHVSLPGAPDGEYFVIQYKTSFGKKKNGIETVTPMKETNGLWRVSGFTII